MWRDMERICASLHLPFVRPDPFPQNGLIAARIALTLDVPARAEFSRAVYRAEFGEGKAISDRAMLGELLSDLGQDPEAVLARAEESANKAELKSQCERAKALGLPGAPCFVTEDEEIFWGNDRLEQAIDWATTKR